MKFSKVIGKVDDKLVEAAEQKLSQVFLELATKYDNDHIGSCMGGDPLIFALMYPVEHVCTLNMPTAATDGKRFYWNPKFVLKLSRIGLRIVCSHEAWHALYMHPQRRGSRLPKLWNIAVDYIVNGTVMEDFKARKLNPGESFSKHLGKFMTLPQYAELLMNPFKTQKGFEDLKPEEHSSSSDVVLPAPNVDRELTAKELQELEKREKQEKFFYADPELSDDMKRPEAIYDFLYNLLPKCPKCGSVGIYKKPKKDKGKDKDKGKGKGKGDKKDKGDKGDKGDKSDQPGDQPGDQDGDCCGDQPGGCCGECGDGMDVFGLGGTLDDHMDTEESEEKLAKRISEAMETARKMAGYVPAGLEDELGKLTEPKIKWQDVIRSKIVKARAGNSRNDWNRFRSRPMFTGLLIPKRKSYFAHFGCLLDTSGSMSKDDMAYGVSQLIGLDDRSEGTITFADSEIYWDKSVKIKNCNQEELRKLTPVGRGGTMFESYLTDYEKNIGKCDFLIIITDGYLLDTDIAAMRDPGIPVYWIITAPTAFNAPFGKVYDLKA
jgi:predicted metal-dependent peptidase